MRAWKVTLLACAVVLSTLALPARAASTWWYKDVPVSGYAASAIWNVAHQNDWMRDSGTTRFYPDNVTVRRVFAVALVRAFARSEAPASAIRFNDVAANAWWAPAVKLAVEKGWMVAPKNVFSPEAPLTKTDMDVALVNALGLSDATNGLNGIHTANGHRFAVPYGFAQMIMAAELGFHVQMHDVSKSLLPFTAVPRSAAAYALWRAVNAGNGWQIWSMRRYRDVTLPAMRADTERAVQFALRYAGYPYVYAGTWYRANDSQAQGGFDCSGFVWWVLHASGPGFNNAALRGYPGWYLPDRSSMQMARNTPRKIWYSQLKPMDIVLFDTNGPRSMDPNAASHAGLALGNGWMIHSSGHRGGVSISWMGEGYWFDHLAWARRVIPS